METLFIEYFTSGRALIILWLCIPVILVWILATIGGAVLSTPPPKGCRKIGMGSATNLGDEFDEKLYGSSIDRSQSDSEVRVKSIWIYPVKSCRGIELSHSDVVSTGMVYDRQFMLARPKRASLEEGSKEEVWEFITQRQFGQLARVRTEVWIPKDSKQNEGLPHTAGHGSDGYLVLKFPYITQGWASFIPRVFTAITGRSLERQFRVPLTSSPEQITQAGYRFNRVTIWKDTVRGLNMEKNVPKELGDFLGIERLGLFRVHNSGLREVYRCAPRKDELGWQPVTGFQDAYPLHLLNLASVRGVEEEMRRNGESSLRLSVRRFRANIIISGPNAYEEDTWKKIRIGKYDYAVSCRTARCKLPNVDPVTGDRHKIEPDRTLRAFRNVDAGAGDKTGCLGMQMVPWEQHSAIKVGDQVQVLERGEHFYIKQ